MIFTKINRKNDIKPVGIELNLREILSFLMGVLCAFFWAIPVWHAPESQLNREVSEVWRGFRLLFPVVAATILVAFSGRRRRLGMLDVLLAAVFLFAPSIAFSLSDHADQQFIVGVVPLAVAGLTIHCISYWRTGVLKAFLMGGGFFLAFLLVARIAIYGLETNSFYGRPRLHLGFDHPLMTASAILMISIATVISINNSRAAWFRYLFSALAIIATIYVLRAVDSRNSTLFGLALVLFSLLPSILPGVVIKLILVGMLPILFVLVSVLSVYAASGAEMIGNFQSIAERFSAWGVAINNLSQGEFSSIHPSANRETFAIFDSLYTTYGFRFGLLGMVLLCVWLQIICTNQIRRRPTTAMDMLGFSGGSAAAIFFFGDTQGITAANLAVFMTLATSYRRAVT